MREKFLRRLLPISPAVDNTVSRRHQRLQPRRARRVGKCPPGHGQIGGDGAVEAAELPQFIRTRFAT